MFCYSMLIRSTLQFFFFFFNDTATTEIYTLSYTTLFRSRFVAVAHGTPQAVIPNVWGTYHPVAFRYVFAKLDRKSTRLNSSHQIISYAVFCLKKKIKITEYVRSSKRIISCTAN